MLEIIKIEKIIKKEEGKIYRIEKCGNKNQSELVQRPQ